MGICGSTEEENKSKGGAIRNPSSDKPSSDPPTGDHVNAARPSTPDPPVETIDEESMKVLLKREEDKARTELFNSMGMGGIVYGVTEDEELKITELKGKSPNSGDRTVVGATEHGIKNPDWEVMTHTSIKDLGGKGYLFTVDVKCMMSTSLAEVQRRVEHRLETLNMGDIRLSLAPGDRSATFSQEKVKITAMVPRLADNWTDASAPTETLADINKKWGATIKEGGVECPKANEDPDGVRQTRTWTKQGQQMPGVRFYATTGDASGPGFEFWEMEAEEQDAELAKSGTIIIDNQGSGNRSSA